MKIIPILLCLVILFFIVSCTTNKKTGTTVHGTVAQGYELVRDEFQRNFTSRGELGAAFAAYVDGVCVVDLWDGWADVKRTRPWQENTEVVVFSATKGVAAMVLAHLHSRGLFNYNDPVVMYWPEFGENGKETVTIRQLISHQAGIVLPASPLDRKDFAHNDQALEKAVPLWEPGSKHGYHAVTVGQAIAALVRRIDPQGRSVNTYLQEEIAGKLGAEFSIGLPATYDRSRLAEIKQFNPLEALFHLGEVPPGLRSVLFNSKSLFWKSMGNTPVDPNAVEFTQGEDPSGNGVGTARGLALLYGELANGGQKIGLSETTIRALFDDPETPSEGFLDQVMNIDARYGLGFQKSVGQNSKTQNPVWFSDNPQAIGFLGASGAFAYADYDLGLGAAYITNRMSPGTQINDPREKALRQALFTAVQKQKTKN